MKLLITGAAGYLGSMITERAVGKGHDVVAVDYGMFTYDGLQGLPITLLKKRVQDLTPEDIKGVEAVLHLAAVSNDPMSEFSPSFCREQNIGGTQHLLDLCADGEYFIFASSASVYGLQQHSLLNEDSAIAPVSAYSQSKAECEKMVQAETDNALILRQATVMGLNPRRMRYDLAVNTMTYTAITEGRIKLYGGGEAWRPFVHVSDVADAWMVALEEKPTGVYNLSHKNYRISELGNYIRHCLYRLSQGELVVDVQVDYDKQEVRSYALDTSKFERTFGWKPNRGVLQSVEEIALDLNSRELNWETLKCKNIDWMKLMACAQEVAKTTGPIDLG
jgi:nucleoside-diphosphate-sugar epimerase